MNILVFNAGSSTLKFQVRRIDGPVEKRLGQGIVEGIGDGQGLYRFSAEEGPRQSGELSRMDHPAAVLLALEWLEVGGVPGLTGLKDIGAVGHRVVHGGEKFSDPARIDAGVLETLEEMTELAPLHNRPALACIRTTRERLGARAPMVAVFDTSFHAAMPPHAAQYAIPRDMATKHGVRRYGFHGIAHRWMATRYAQLAGRAERDASLVTLQLGNGCSAAAIQGGRSVDTSMGFTPLEGLVMGTRSGDVDPSVIGYLARREGVSCDTVEGWLNERSGLLGVSERSQDMRELERAAREQDPLAELAIDLFCYRVKKYIGAYLAALGGGEAIVFGGGIGERSPMARQRICQGLEWLGLKLDPSRNEAAVGREAAITADGSRLAAYVIPVEEEVLIARDTFALLDNA